MIRVKKTGRLGGISREYSGSIWESFINGRVGIKCVGEKETLELLRTFEKLDFRWGDIENTLPTLRNIRKEFQYKTFYILCFDNGKLGAYGEYNSDLYESCYDVQMRVSAIDFLADKTVMERVRIERDAKGVGVDDAW